MNQKGTGKVESRALCSHNWAGGTQLPNFLLCLEADKKKNRLGIDAGSVCKEC